MELAYKRFGSGQPVIILHGLYGSSDNWVTIAKELSDLYEVYLVDQRNHGNSPNSDSHTYDNLARDLFVFIAHHDIHYPILIGHSMGGKAVMAFALKYPEIVKKLIVVDIAPRSYKSLTGYSQQILDHMNIMNALLNIDMEQVKSRKEVDKQLNETIKSFRLRSFLLKNVRRTQDGRYTWKLNLESIQKNLPNIVEGVIADADKYNKDAINELPVLFIKGEKSDYIVEEDVLEIKQLFPLATIEIIPNAGHWLHFEQANLFIKIIRDFIFK